MNRFYRTALIVLFCGLSNWLSAQQNQRYLLLSLGNNYIGSGDNGIESINQLKANGGNGVMITMLWSTINNWRKDDPNPWQQYDDQVAAARRNGMKIAIRIWIDNQRFDTPSDPNNNFEDGFNGWSAADRMQGYNVFGQDLRVYQHFDGLYQNRGTFRVFTSFAAPATIEKGTTFAARVAQRYSYLLNTNELLFMCVANNGQGEFGYPYTTTKGLTGDYERLFDYSDPMVKGFRNWLKAKYRGSITRLKSAWKGDGQPGSSFDQISPKAPNGEFKGAFEGEAGRDWYRYRHGVMKTFLYEVAAAIKAVDNRFKVIPEYGAVHDKLSVQRGTFSFKDIGESMDGIKINDGNFSDFRFSTDLVRSNMPGKLIVNEVGGNAGRINDPVPRSEQIRQFTDCYEFGTQIITIFNFDLTYPPDRDVVREVAARYLATTANVIRKPEQSATYTTSGILTAGGCNATGASPLDCQAYKDWRTVHELNGGKPVNFYQQDDILFPPTVEIPRYSRVLVIGNALTENAPDATIGWTGGPWGMAATSRANDYVSLLTEKLKEQNPDVSVQRLRLDDWEKTYASKAFPYKTAVTDKVAAFWPGNKPDLVLISLSENVSQTNFDAATFRDEVLKLVVSTGFTTGVAVLRNSFLPGKSQSNAVLRRVADETGWQFVNLACIRGDVTYTAATDWPKADSLVKQYPGNAGMDAIANLYCSQIPGLNCNQIGPTPTISKIRIHFGVDSCQTCSDRCRNGLIQGSQDSTSWTTLAILSQPARGWNEFVVNANQPWRYVRYVAAKNCFAELTELEFYEGNRKLAGKVFNSGTSSSGNGYRAALDGNLATVWRGTTPGPQNTLGLDFGVPSTDPDPIVWCPEADESKQTAQLELAPNPADEFVTYLYQMPTTEAVTIDVFDMAGRRVSHQQLAGSDVRQQYRAYVGDWQAGLYIVKIKAGTFAASKRILIAR